MKTIEQFGHGVICGLHNRDFFASINSGALLTIAPNKDLLLSYDSHRVLTVGVARTVQRKLRHVLANLRLCRIQLRTSIDNRDNGHPVEPHAVFVNACSHEA